MAVEYSLDQRRYRLNLSNKQLHEECKKRGQKIGYSTVLNVINNPGESDYRSEKIVKDVISELEAERGITDINFC